MINPDAVSGPCTPRTAASHRTRTPAGAAKPSNERIPSGGSDHDAGSARLIRHLLSDRQLSSAIMVLIQLIMLDQQLACTEPVPPVTVLSSSSERLVLGSAGSTR